MIIRHGEDEAGVKRIYGNAGLTEHGKRQVEALLPVLKKFEPMKVITSPLQRAYQTAEILTTSFSIPLETNELLHEQYPGKVFEQPLAYKQYWDEEKQLKGYIQLENGFPDGETYQMLSERAKTFWNSFTEQYLREEKEQDEEIRLILVTHGRFMTFLIAHAIDYPPNGFFLAIDNCAYLVLNVSPNWRTQIVLPS